MIDLDYIFQGMRLTSCISIDFFESNHSMSQVGLQASAWVSVGTQVGDEVEVQVEEAHPRDDVLSLKEVIRN